MSKHKVRPNIKNKIFYIVVKGNKKSISFDSIWSAEYIYNQDKADKILECYYDNKGLIHEKIIRRRLK